MRAEAAAAFAAFALAGLFVVGDAAAFCRTTTVAVPPDHNPVDGCFLQGVPLYHPSSCLPYRLQNKESAKLPNAQISDKLARAFAAWTAPNPVCTPGIAAIELAPVDDELIANYVQGQRGHNIVGVPATWPHTGGGETLALATLTFNADSGEIYDVDLEINPNPAWSFTETPPAEGFDLESALTHEVGHMLGFAHTEKPDATMFASYTPGTTTIRDLDRDDQDAICWVYPSRTQRLGNTGLIPATPCNLAQGSPGTNGCGDPEITHGCTIGQAMPSNDSSAMIGAAALALLGLSRLRRSVKTQSQVRSRSDAR